jgi:hypothetical protein
MTWRALEIPDDPARLAPWLEGHLIGPDLARLVAELEAVHGPLDTSSDLDTSLERHTSQVLERGLEILSPAAMRTLLTHPRLLLTLQARVLGEGGPFWLAARSRETDALVEHGRQRLGDYLRDQAAAEAAPDGPRPLPAFDGSPPGPSTGRRRAWRAALATAVLLLMGVFLWQQFQSPEPVSARTAWGWNAPGAMADNVAAPAYLMALAKAADEWFNERPDDAESLARRIGEFRAGCDRLILAQHRPLAPADRQWLIGKCQAWSAKFDAHLADLHGGRDAAAVRAEADQTIRSLSEALRSRSRALSPA